MGSGPICRSVALAGGLAGALLLAGARADDLFVEAGATQWIAGVHTYEKATILGTLLLLGDTTLTLNWGDIYTNLPPTNVLILGENAIISCDLEPGAYGQTGARGTGDGGDGGDGMPGEDGADGYAFTLRVSGNVLASNGVYISMDGTAGGSGGHGGDGASSSTVGGRGGAGAHGGLGGHGGAIDFGCTGTVHVAGTMRLQCVGGFGGYGGVGGDGGSLMKTNGTTGGPAGDGGPAALGGSGGSIFFSALRVSGGELALYAGGYYGGAGGSGGQGGSQNVTGGQGRPGGRGGAGGSVVLRICDVLARIGAHASGGHGYRGGNGGGGGFGGNPNSGCANGAPGTRGGDGGAAGEIDAAFGLVKNDVLLGSSGGRGGAGARGGGTANCTGSLRGAGGNGGDGAPGGVVTSRVFKGEALISAEVNGGAVGHGASDLLIPGEVPGVDGQAGAAGWACVETETTGECGCGVIIDEFLIDDAILTNSVVNKAQGDIVEAVVRLVNLSTNAQSAWLSIDTGTVAPWVPVLDCFSIRNLTNVTADSLALLPYEQEAPGAPYVIACGALAAGQVDKVVFRFQLPGSLRAGPRTLRAWVETNDVHEAEMRVVREIPAVVIVNRVNLYKYYGLQYWTNVVYGWDTTNRAVQRLTGLYELADGREPGERECVIYYADLYDPEVAQWDNARADLYGSEASANLAASKIRERLATWTAKLTRGEPPYIVLFGADHLVPFCRIPEIAGIPRSESTYTGGLPVSQNNYFFCDQAYADLEGDYSLGRGVDACIGRTIGRLDNALRGPSGPRRAVVCNDPVNDTDAIVDCYVSNDIEVRQRGGPYATVDNENWMELDLRDAVSNGCMAVTVHSHSNHRGHQTGGGDFIDSGILYGEYADVWSACNPFVALFGCHSLLLDERDHRDAGGSSIALGALLTGASGVLGWSTYFAFYGSADVLGYAEEYGNQIHCELADGGDVGHAIRSTSWGYADGTPLDALDKRTLAGVIFLGLPWMDPKIVAADAPARRASVRRTLADMAPGVPYRVASPRGLHASSTRYAVDVTVSVPHYVVTNTLGYARVEIDGAELEMRHGYPVVPRLHTRVVLPPDSANIECTAVASNAVQLGALNLGYANASVTVDPQPAITSNILALTGVQPQPGFGFDSRVAQNRCQVDLYARPVRHDCGTRQTTILTNLTLRLAYDANSPLVVSDVALAAEEVASAASVPVIVTVRNAGADALAGLTAVTRVFNATDQVVTQSVSAAFGVAAGASLPVPLTFAAPGARGSYTLQADVMNGATTGATALAAFRVREGVVMAWQPPAVLHQEQTGVVFRAVFRNDRAGAVSATLQVRLVNAVGYVLATLRSATVTVASGAGVTLEATGDILTLPLGLYTAIMTVDASGTPYGPWSTPLELLRPLPTVALVTPGNEAGYAAPASVALAAVAASRNGSVTQVVAWVDNTVLATLPAAPYEVVWTNVPIGYYTLRAQAFNQDGASAGSAPVRVLVTNSVPDADGNGVPDAWEIRHGLYGSVTVTSDHDGDGMPDVQECRADTDPTNALSRLELLQVLPSQFGQGYDVRWRSVTSRGYLLQRGGDLRDTNSFSVLNPGFPVPGGADWTEYWDYEAGSTGAYFYRVLTDPSWE